MEHAAPHLATTPQNHSACPDFQLASDVVGTRLQQNRSAKSIGPKGNAATWLMAA